MTLCEIIMSWITILVVWVVCCWVLRGHKATSFFIAASIVGIYWIFALLFQSPSDLHIVYNWWKF